VSSLSERLKRLKAVDQAPPVRRDASKAGSVGRRPGPEWSPAGPGVWERRLVLPLRLPGVFDDPLVLPESATADQLLFYDLETTGLSGGTGNTAFLVGLGRVSGSGFEVIQLFLEDYPGEPILLERLAELSGSAAYHVSYNGRSFDSQVLRTRYLLNRMPPPDSVQIDLLYPTRRLWSPVLPECRLGRVEQDVLGFRREDDLPGRDAPDAWFAWLEGDAGQIQGVFRHNADDIASLARLLLRIEDWGRQDPAGAEEPDRPDGAEPSRRGLARQWALRNPSRARAWLQAGWDAGDRSCGPELALLYRRDGDIETARKIWEVLDGPDRDYVAAVELAKYWEHRKKNPLRALEILDGLDAPDLSEGRRRDLAYRRRRLSKAIE